MSHVDAHHHVWCPESRSPDLGYGWLRDIGAPKPFGDPTPIQRDYLWPEYLAETPEPPAASIHVQADNAVDGLAEARWAAETARAAGHIFGIVARMDLAAADVVDRLAALAALPEARGVRQIVARDAGRPSLSFAPSDLLTSTDWRRGLAALARTDLSFDLQLYAHQVDAALAALAPHPELAVIVDHAASPVDGPTPRWRDATATLAARPRTWIKLSGWGMFDADWTAETVAPMVAHLLDMFGSDRVMFGSNYPVEKLARRYSEVLADTRSAILMAEGDVEAVVAKTARVAYRL